MPAKKPAKPRPAKAGAKSLPHGRSTKSKTGDILMDDAPPRQPGRQGTTRKEREKLPVCGAKGRSGKPCQNPAGKGTDHPGEGRCKFHGGVTHVKDTRFEVGRYSDLRVRPRLKELIDKFASEVNVDDLSHEITILRALV